MTAVVASPPIPIDQQSLVALNRLSPASLVRIDPVTNTIVATLDAPGEATGLARIGRSVWAVGSGGDVAAADNETNTIVFNERLLPPDTKLGGDRLAIGFDSI